LGLSQTGCIRQNPAALAVKMTQSKQWQGIPTNLTLQQFDEFVLPHLTRGSRGPHVKLTLHKIFNYILLQLYLGFHAQPREIFDSYFRASKTIVCEHGN
jgi:hypothetical protein